MLQMTSGMERSTLDMCSISASRAPSQQSVIRYSLFLVDPTRQMAELPLVLGPLTGAASSHSSNPLFLAQSADAIAELEFSEDRAPLVCGHCDLLIPNDIFFLVIRGVTTHCVPFDVGSVLKADLHLSPWALALTYTS